MNNIFRNKLVSLTLSTAVAGFLFASSAYGQDKTASLLNPNGEWAVKAMAAQTDNGYCALSRKYDQNLIVTLGKNKREEYSFAIDFVNASLNPDRAYDVTLQPGPGQIRAYEMMPASARAMVIRLGYDDSFVKALEKSGQLKAEIDGKTYTFNLSEFETGNRSLEKCMVSLKSSSTQVASTEKTPQPKEFHARKIERAEPLRAVPAPEVIKASPTKAVTIKKSVSDDIDNRPKSEVERIAELESQTKNIEDKISDDVQVPRPPAIEINKVESKIVDANIDVNNAEAQAKEIEKKAQQMALAQQVKARDEKIKKAEIAARDEAARKAQEENIAMKAKEEAEKKAAVKRVAEQKAAQEKAEQGKLAREARALEQAAQDKIEKEKIALQAAQKEREKQQRLANEEKARKALEVQRLAAEKVEAEKAEQLRLTEVARQKAAEKKAEAERKAKKLAEAEKLEKQKQQTEKAQKQREEKIAQERATVEAEKLKLAAEEKRKKEEVKLARMTPEPDNFVPLTPDVPTGRPFEKRHEILKTPKAKEALSDLDKLEAENNKLSQALENEEKKVQALDRNAPEAQAELEKIKARMAELEQENRALYLEARKARGEIDTAVVATSNQALAKMREYEKKLEAARADNLTLSQEIEELRLLKENGKLDVVAGDWDLEKSMGRYNEAEREIKRLGLLLEQQRLAHRQEKVELEQMLFDPAVTDRAQRARLSELEAQLSAAERQLQTGQRVAARPKIAATAMTDMPSIPAPRVPHAPLSERVDAMSPGATRFPKVEDTPMTVSARQVPTAPRAPLRQPIQTSPRQEVPRVPATSSNAAIAPVKRAPARSVLTFGVRDINAVLNKSGININGSIRQRQAGQYQWQSGKLSGYAEVIPASQSGGLDNLVNQYIAQKERACSGDFASLPAPTVQAGRGFEVACITPTSSMSSSLVFKARGDNIIVIGHDIPAEDMDLAMDVRDRIAGNL